MNIRRMGEMTRVFLIWISLITLGYLGIGLISSVATHNGYEFYTAMWAMITTCVVIYLLVKG